MAHAEGEWPNVACGVLAGRGDEIYQTYACDNTAEDKRVTFDLLASDLLHVDEETRQNAWTLVGLYHSQPHAAALPSTHLAASPAWEGFCVLSVSLLDAVNPSVRIYRIESGGFSDLKLVVEDDDVYPADHSLNERICEIRGDFAENHYTGWKTWLREFGDRLEGLDHAGCQVLISELRAGGYDLPVHEDDRLTELHDLVLFRIGGEGELWSHYERELAGCQTDTPLIEARIRFRLGLVYLGRGAPEACRSHWERCSRLIPANSGTGFAEQVSSALSALTEQGSSTTLHPLLRMLWRSVTEPRFDADQEFHDLTSRAMQGSDWRRGRQAVKALEDEGQALAIGDGLQGASQLVRVAALAALRRLGVDRSQPVLIEALRDESPGVRLQAARALAGAKEDAAPDLVWVMQNDTDVDVRIAAVISLGEIADRDLIPTLKAVRDAHNGIDRTLSEAVEEAVSSIELRFPIIDPYSYEESPEEQFAPIKAALEETIRGFYVRQDRLLQALLVALGAAAIALINGWFAIGYLAYAVIYQIMLEPRHLGNSFFASQPCYSGIKPRSVNPERDFVHLRFLQVPLWLVPVAASLIGLLRSYWWFFIGLAIAALAVTQIRSAQTARHACKYCNRKNECFRWHSELRQISENIR